MGYNKLALRSENELANVILSEAVKYETDLIITLAEVLRRSC